MTTVNPRRALYSLGILLAVVAITAITMFLWVLRDTTIYAEGFTEVKFEQVDRGMNLSDIYRLLGEPLAVREEGAPERWCYDQPAPISSSGSSQCLLFDNIGKALHSIELNGVSIVVGMRKEQVLKALGEPRERSPAISRTLHYSEPGGDGLFKARIIGVDPKNRVCKIVKYQFYD